MELFKILGTIAISNADANDAIDDTTEKAEKSESKISSAFKKIGTAVATAFAVDKIKDFGLNCINAAADASAASSQFTQVFGDMEDTASKSLKGIADDTGIQVNRMKGSYTQIAAFAKTTGMDTESAMNLSNRALAAVADSAAFYDRSLEETTESLQSFLKGNYENDAALGLSATETTRNAAANKLYGQSFNDLSESQKQLTLLQMVEDANKVSGALGQAARESDTWTNQTGNLQQAWTNLQATIGSNFLGIAVQTVKKVSDAVVQLNSKMPDIIERITDFKNKAVESGEYLISVFSPTMKVLGDLFDIVKTAVLNTLDPLITWISSGDAAAQSTELLKNVIEAVAAALTAVVQKITEFILWLQSGSEEAEAFKGVVLGIVTAFTAFRTVMMIQGIIQGAVTAIGTLQNAITVLKGGFTALHAVMVANPVGLIVAAIAGLVAAFLYLWNNCEGFRQFWIQLWGIIKTTATTTVSNMINGLNTAKETAGRILDSIKEKFTNIFEGAKDIVKNAIDKIRGFFDFDWSLPNIKLPHFSIDGSFSLNPPSIPHFSVAWYKKAMDEPYMFTKPTIFDVNPATGHAKGAGEAGDEVMIGKDTMLNMIRQAVASENNQMIQVILDMFEKLFAIMEEFYPQFANMQLVTDTGALVGELAPAMDEELGEIQRRRERQ